MLVSRFNPLQAVFSAFSRARGACLPSTTVVTHSQSATGRCHRIPSVFSTWPIALVKLRSASVPLALPQIQLHVSRSCITLSLRLYFSFLYTLGHFFRERGVNLIVLGFGYRTDRAGRTCTQQSTTFRLRGGIQKCPRRGQSRSNKAYLVCKPGSFHQRVHYQVLSCSRAQAVKRNQEVSTAFQVHVPQHTFVLIGPHDQR